MDEVKQPFEDKQILLGVTGSIACYKAADLACRLRQAGALVDGGTIARGESAGHIAEQALARADAGTFLEASGDLIQTGPTGTNVMDIMLGLRAK